MENTSKNILPAHERVLGFNHLHTEVLWGNKYMEKVYQALESSENRVNELEDEIERLKGLIEKAHELGVESGYYGSKENFKRFKNEHNL